MIEQPTFFDVDPEAAPEGSKPQGQSQGEPNGQPQAPVVSIAPVNPVTLGSAGVDVEERQHTGPEEKNGIQPVIASATTSREFNSPQAPPNDDETWREVPQALFCSWSVQRQLDYCARRDKHASLYASDDGDEWAGFYYRRAEMYRQMLVELR